MSQPPPRADPEDAPDSRRQLVGATAFRLLAVAAVVALVALSVGRPVPLLPAADSPTAGPAADDSFVRLERHGCFGTCPVFSVTVCGDGRVEYVGRRFVRVTGRVEYRIPESRARGLLALAREVDFADFRSEYEDNLVDDPTAAMAVRTDGRTHRVDFEPDAGPDGLHRLAGAVEAVAHPYADQRDDSGAFRGEVGNASAAC